MPNAPKEPPVDTSERILECAEELFGARGYDSVAVSDIAEACGVSTSLIYYHYRDKESLLRALVRRAQETLGAPAIEALNQDGSASDRIQAFVYTWIRAAVEHVSLLRIFIRPAIDPEGPLSDELLSQTSRTVVALAQVIAEGVSAGEFADVDPHLSAECLFALVNTRMVIRAIDAPLIYSLDKTAEELAEFICALFMDGIRPC